MESIIIPEGAHWTDLEVRENGETRTITVLIHDGCDPESQLALSQTNQ